MLIKNGLVFTKQGFEHKDIKIVDNSYIDKNTKHAHFSPSDGGCDMILRRTDGSYSRG